MITTAHTICRFCQTRTAPPTAKTCGTPRCEEALEYWVYVNKCRRGSSKRAEALLVYASVCATAKAEARAPKAVQP